MPKRILNFLTASAIVLFAGTAIRSLPVAATAPAPHANPAGEPPDRNRQERQPQTEGPGLASADTEAPTSGLDSLLTAETMAETWTDAFPDETGMRRRVRIAKAPADGAMLRIEEEVRTATGETPVRVGGAMAAGHILVGSRHAALLETEGLVAEPAKSPAYVRVRVPEPETPLAIPALIARLNALGITDLSPDGFARPAGLSGDPEVGSGSSWHLENLGTYSGTKAGADINAAGAWEHRTDASPILIALLDSGILHGEPDLAESIYSFPGETAGDGIDNDGNGYIDDVQGYDFADDDPDPTPANMHGTACASLIGARGGNGTRSSGIAWKASILNCKIYTSIGHFGAISDIIDAIDYSIASGARIINLSWTYDTASPLLEQALSRASQAGVILVCAAGNQIPSQLLSELPARIALPGSMDLPLLVTVAASGPDDTLAPFTKVDPAKVDIAAPGVNIPLSLMGGGGRVDYSPSLLSGSSYATALVSGGLALAMAEHPDESPSQIIRRLLETADPVPGGAAMLSSGGRMNVGRMLTAELPAVAHDRFADRRILTEPAGQWTGSNTGAGIEPVDSTGSPSPAPARTLWFEWTAANSGMLTISAAMPQGSPTVRVFRSSGGAPAALAGQFLKGKPLTVAVTQGEKLFWMLDSTTPAAAGLKIAWQLPPSNDSIATAPAKARQPRRYQPVAARRSSRGRAAHTFQTRLAQPHIFLGA